MPWLWLCKSIIRSMRLSMKVDLIDYMGSDLTVVNSARVSFNKESEWEEPYVGAGYEELKASDKKLIQYLATHGHWTPFAHPQITLRVKAPIFVARQLYKHKVGFTENEISRRYVDDEPEFFFPETWRGRPVDGAKQGSSGTSVERITFHGINETWETDINDIVGNCLDHCANLYKDLIEGGVAPEQARMVLPQAMYTEWYWTASLSAYARMCRQRLDAHAQSETREIAQMISDIISPLFPVSWSTLIETNN